VTNQLHVEGAVFLFGPFRLISTRKLSLDGDTRGHVGNRTLEILIALVERHGELVNKQELMARVWPRAVVEDANFKVQIAALRKALGEGPQGQRYLAMAIGQGSLFVAAVECEMLPPDTPLFAEPLCVAHNLPAAPVDPIGRSSTIRAISGQLSLVRLLTVTGPGGIGKTTVALAVAREMAEAGHHDVWFVDLCKLSDADLVPQLCAQ
jgi:DNA-binding winged helix-turn-helix (wHTH) protein